MNKIELAGGNVCLYHADMRAAIKLLPDNSIDSVVCDPPYHLTSIVKRFGGANAAPAQYGSDGAFARASKGFMNKVWDGGDIAFQPETWAECLRVLKPGGHVAAFGASRGYHRMACAIEDAGFEIRDSLMWIYGTGFPKSHDVSKGIDSRKDWASLERLGAAIKTARTKLGLSQTEAARRVGLIAENESLGGGGFMWFETGRMPTREEWPRIKLALVLGNEFDEAFEAAEREVIGQHKATGPGTNMRNGLGGQQDRIVGEITRPLSEAARQWEGWGTALKPAFEPIVLARKPLSESTVAANVLRLGTGALNIGATRIGTETLPAQKAGQAKLGTFERDDMLTPERVGRWPANVVHDGSDEVVGMFPNNVARFFYSAKASKADRAGSKHPTVKPVALMQWLARLITPPGGTVLDPFAGSGTTGAACALEGFPCVLVEREDEYVQDIRRRLSAPQPAMPHVAAAAAVQQPVNDNQPRDLFSGLAA